VFLQNDPVHTTNLQTFIRDQLEAVQSKLGGVEAFREICLRNVDQALVDQMNTMLL